MSAVLPDGFFGSESHRNIAPAGILTSFRQVRFSEKLTQARRRASLAAPMNAFPAFFPLVGRTVVIAGDGEAAEAKARLFEGSPAMVIRLNGDDALSPKGYAGAALAFIAGGDMAFVEAAARAARAAGAPVNVVDHAELCDFFTPALVDRGEVVAAVGTGGASPMLSAMLRNDIEAQVPEGAGRVAALLGAAQDEVRAAFPDLGERRAFLRDALNGPAARAAMDGDMDRARTLLRQALAGDAQASRKAAGRVCFIRGEGPADLLSLRACRALGQAEVVIADAGASPGVLGLARREASRLAPADAGADRIIELAQEGRQIVRLVLGPPDAGALRALAAAGVVVEVLASAPA
jgi:precorrin-2 dehydrogenase/sirohydrochlorin ferrochelatase